MTVTNSVYVWTWTLALFKMKFSQAEEFLGIHEVYKKNILRIFPTSMKEKRHDKDPGHQRVRSTPLTSGDHHVKLLPTWTYLLQGFHKFTSSSYLIFVTGATGIPV